MSKVKIKVEDLHAAVEVSVSAALPQIVKDIEQGVAMAFEKIDFKRTAMRETLRVIDEIFSEEITNAIRSESEKASRDQLKHMVAGAVETLFKKWLAERPGISYP